VKNFIFSSSATVYGEPENLPLKESSRTGLGITNPYGQTKYMVEQILMDLGNAEKDWNIVILRYFNPVGAHPSGRIGEDPNGIPNNLMPFVAQVAIGKLPVLKIYGRKFDTPDGTGVRDYIHIVDLAKGHVAALDRITKSSGGVEVYNLGTGKGYSVLDMVKGLEKASGRKIATEDGVPRPGDLPEVYCDPSLAREKLGWEAQFGIEEMCRDLWNWQQQNPNGFKSASK
jgi:UDP-glucose 4-epimerase